MIEQRLHSCLEDIGFINKCQSGSDKISHLFRLAQSVMVDGYRLLENNSNSTEFSNTLLEAGHKTNHVIYELSSVQ